MSYKMGYHPSSRAISIVGLAVDGSELQVIAIAVTDQTLVHAISVLASYMPNEVYRAAYQALATEHGRRKNGAAPLAVEMARRVFDDLPEEVRALLTR